MFIRVAVITLAMVTFSRAQSRPIGLEPGEAEGRNKTRELDPNLKFNHPAVETRGVWVASNDLLGPRDVLLHKFDRLKSAHFTTVMIDSWFRGYTAYPDSAIAPEYPDLKGEDTLGVMMDEAHKHGLHVQAWISYGFYAYWTKDASKDSSMGPILTKYPELASVDAQGRKLIHRTVGDFYSLCAANPKSHEILGQIMKEIVTRYAWIDGIHLDRIRFPEADFCYCDYCKTHFQQDTGIELKPFKPNTDEHLAWINWKRQQTLAAVKHFAAVIHSVNRKLPITAYVVGPDEMDARGQSWDLWAKEGVLDAIAVSMYNADIHPAADKALARLGDARSRLICALSADNIPTPIYAANIQAARDVSPLGQYTWFLGQLDDADFDALEAGPYSQPARDPIIK
jgi:uncharacterized lipoprotein YddW (UPF0748 family)